MLLAGCGDSPRKQAHYENVSGITHDAFRRHDSARPHYERSRGFGIEPEIPTHNLARSVALAGDVSEAHDLFQEALTLEPALTEAFFNDGVTLYTWGEKERDPENCDLERTRELWAQAAARFASTAGHPRAEKELREKGRANHRFLSESLAEIDRLIAEPPEHCLSESEATGGGGAEDEQESDQNEEQKDEESGGGSGGGGSSGGEGDEDENQGGGAGGQGDEQEDQGGGGEGDENEDEGGGPDGEQDQDQGDGDNQEGETDPEDPDGDSPGGGGGAGGGESPEPSDGPGSGPSGGLTAEQLAGIRELIQQLGERGREGERFHRRTGPEQFSKGDWSDPDPYLWW
jgi:hypothetical protein